MLFYSFFASTTGAFQHFWSYYSYN